MTQVHSCHNNNRAVGRQQQTSHMQLCKICALAAACDFWFAAGALPPWLLCHHRICVADGELATSSSLLLLSDTLRGEVMHRGADWTIRLTPCSLDSSTCSGSATRLSPTISRLAPAQTFRHSLPAKCGLQAGASQTAYQRLQA